MRISLKNFIVPSIPLAVFLVVACCSLWGVSFSAGHYSPIPISDNTFAEILQSIFKPDTVISKLISLAFTLLNAFLIAQINNRFTIIRIRTFLPVFIFLILMGSWSQTHTINGSQISLSLFIVSLFYFFNMSRNGKATEEAFMGTLIIAVSSLLIRQLIFLIPVCWIGFMIFQSFSLRTFLASLFGLLTPWIIYISINYYYYFGSTLNLKQFFDFHFDFSFQISTFTLPELIYSALISIVMIIALAGMFSITNRDAIHTRNKLNFLLLLLVVFSLMIIVFRNHYFMFLPFIAAIYAMLISHPLTLKQNIFYGILFVIFCILNIAFIISKFIFY